MNTISTDLAYDPILFGKDVGRSAKQEKVSKEFESLFIYQLLKEMDKTVDRDEEGIFFSEYEDTYRSMFYQEMSRSIANSGGIGLADYVNNELTLLEGEK